MNFFQKKNNRDVASMYPKFELTKSDRGYIYADKCALNAIYGTSFMKKPVIPLSPKLFKEILLERFAKEVTPFIKVDIGANGNENSVYYTFYNVVASFNYKGMRYEVCALVNVLDTDTVVKTYLSLRHDIIERIERS